MCGLVGVAGLITPDAEKAFKNMLILDSIRGMDSTGVAFVAKDGTADVVKAVGNPFDLMEYRPFEKRMNRVNKALIGHNRFATHGKIVRQNAHPFHYGSIVGAHNGMLRNQHVLDEGSTFPVDSEAAIYNFNKNGVENTIPKLLGAWSFVFWDSDSETLNFVRNKERPMFYAFTEAGSTLFWASEPWMIQASAPRHGLKIGEIHSTPVNVLVQFKMENYGIQLHSETVLEGAVEPVYKHVPFHVVGHHTQQQQQTSSGAGPNQSVTPTGKVVNFPPATPMVATEPTNNPSVLASGAYLVGYSNRKSVTLEVISSEQRDNNGSRFIVLYDTENPQIALRLYLKDGDKAETYQGRNVIADIGKFYYKSGKEKEGYYKIQYSSHRLEIESEKFKNSKGEMVSFSDWLSQHNQCCWCSAPVMPNEKHIFPQNIGDDSAVLCGDCITDEEVNQYIK